MHTRGPAALTNNAGMDVWIDLALALPALAVALWLRPWRGVDSAGPPWPWLAWWALLPALWGVDRYVDNAVVQPLSGACLLVLMAGWPLAVLGLLPVALFTAWAAHLPWDQALHRGVWLGLVPATLTLLLGAGVRRWLPHHLFVYILGRGFFATAVALSITSVLALALHGGVASLSDSDLMIGRWLSAWGDAFITGMVVAIFVAFRPQWLATYTDSLYLPR
jgi:uncharacterized membrane protein